MNVKAALAALLVAAVVLVAMVPAQETDAAYSNITGEDVVATGSSESYDIVYSNHDYDDYNEMSIDVKYVASLKDRHGDTVTSGVSPSSGSIVNGTSETLTVSVPSSTGRYTLEVTYTATITYVDEEGETQEIEEEREDSFRLRAVEGITLSVTLTSDSDVDLTRFGVYFYVDGEKIEDSYTTVSLSGSGTATVSYKWIAVASDGKHTFTVLPADNGQLFGINGLGEEYTFYIGDNDYTWVTALLVVIIILILIVIYWLYRRPVRNYGKPRSRSRRGGGNTGGNTGGGRTTNSGRSASSSRMVIDGGEEDSSRRRWWNRRS